MNLKSVESLMVKEKINYLLDSPDFVDLGLFKDLRLCRAALAGNLKSNIDVPVRFYMEQYI